MINEPASEANMAETPAPEASVPDAPVPDTPVPEEPVPEEPVPEEPVPEEPVPEANMAEASVQESLHAETPAVDGLLLLTYGGPESLSEVRPFVTSVLGSATDESRIDISVRRYESLGGISPINQQSRALVVRLINHFQSSPQPLPVYWSTLHGQPELKTVVSQIATAGVKHLAVFVPTPFRLPYMQKKYEQALSTALEALGPVTEKPLITWLPPFFDHPLFVEAQVQALIKGQQFLQQQQIQEQQLQQSQQQQQQEQEYQQYSQTHEKPLTLTSESQYDQPLSFDQIFVVFSVHSVPSRWPEAAEYDRQYDHLCRQIADQLKLSRWTRAFQSRAGSDMVEWLSPEVGEVIWSLRAKREKPPVLIVPLGFPLDNMEVACDLDYQMGILCRELDVPMFRTSTASAEDAFISMIGDLLDNVQKQ